MPKVAKVCEENMFEIYDVALESHKNIFANLTCMINSIRLSEGFAYGKTRRHGTDAFACSSAKWGSRQTISPIVSEEQLKLFE